MISEYNDRRYECFQPTLTYDYYSTATILLHSLEKHSGMALDQQNELRKRIHILMDKAVQVESSRDRVYDFYQQAYLCSHTVMDIKKNDENYKKWVWKGASMGHVNSLRALPDLVAKNIRSINFSRALLYLKKALPQHPDLQPVYEGLCAREKASLPRSPTHSRNGCVPLRRVATR